MTEHEQIIDVESPKGRSLWQDGLRRLRRRKLVMLCFAIIVLYFLLAGFVYLAELFDLQVGPTLWAEEAGGSYEAPS